MATFICVGQNNIRFSKAKQVFDKYSIYQIKNQKDIDAFIARKDFSDLLFLEIKESSDALFEKLPEATGLRRLTLQKIGLEFVPDAIYELKELQFLSLQQNPIKTLPRGICALKNLNELVLWDTEIHRFPGCIEELPLRRVDLFGVQMNQYDQIALKELLPTATLELEEACDCEFDD